MNVFIPRSRIYEWLGKADAHPYLRAVREGIALTLPVVVAGVFVAFLNGLPFAGYQELMQNLFGTGWKLFGTYVERGTFAITALLMTVSIANSLAEHHNGLHPLDRVAPALVSFIALSCLIATMELDDTGSALPLHWLGGYGIFLGVIISLLSSIMFLALRQMNCFRVVVYISSSGPALSQALAGLMPACITICTFGLAHVLLKYAGVDNIHLACYHLITWPFRLMNPESLGTASLFGVVQNILWFFGVHGSNVMSSVTQEVWGPLEQLNMEMMKVGVLDPRASASFRDVLQGVDSPYSIFTRSFFSVYMAIGGAGCSLGLLFACVIAHRDTTIKRIARLSLIPSLFNINEILLFGIPVILNPIYAIPFLLAPLVVATTSYCALASGLVPVGTQAVPWNMPVLLNAYMASGAVAGSILQVVNVALVTSLYIPFVRLDSRLKAWRLSSVFAELIKVSSDSHGVFGAERLTEYPGRVGGLARSLANDLRLSIANNELYLLYQPQVDSDTGIMVGVESLMRWNHPHLGLIPPPVFISLAEEIGFIDELGLWGIQESVRQLGEWRKAGKGLDVVMAVNISVLQCEDPMFPEKVMGILKQYDVPVDRIKLEVTETTALTQKVIKSRVIAELHAMNIQLAIDDFGMGHSSIVYLKKFPVAYLKFDSSLTRDVLVSRSSREIISMVCDLCRNLYVQVAAEYVETEEHLLQIRELGCSLIQGYFYSKPLPPDECLTFMQQTHAAYGSIDQDVPAIDQ